MPKKIFGIITLSVLLFSSFAYAVNYGSGNYGTGLYSAAVPDTVAPVISSGMPTGILASGTTQTTLSVSTDEVATCKYGTVQNTTYASMSNTFTTTGSTYHSASIIGLSNGVSYTTYIRCSDTVSNVNTADYTIIFSVATQSAPSGGGGISGGSSVLPASTISSTASAISPTVFTINLHFGMTNAQIKLLQKYLNEHGYPVTKIGPGAVGHETVYFGSATKTAVMKFQKVHKIKVDGLVGPGTRALLK